MTEGFSSNATVNGGDTFYFSLVFPIECRETVEAYVKAVGKDELSKRIMREAEEWA